MSKFTSSSNSFKNIKSHAIPITTKFSQKELKKQKKLNTQNSQSSQSSQDSLNLRVTDEEFALLMEENTSNASNASNSPSPSTSTSNSLKFKSSPIQNYSSILEPNSPTKIDPINLVTELVKLIDYGIEGSELCEKVKKISEKQSSVTSLANFLNVILTKQTNPNDVLWLNSTPTNGYGLTIKYLTGENNMLNQLVCLLMIQDYCKRHSYPKITWKNNQTYLIRVLFQILFVSDIIDEQTYWNWQEYVSESNEFDFQTKQTLSIQTTDFFLILNHVFDEKDYEEEGDEANPKTDELDQDELMAKPNNKSINLNPEANNEDSDKSEPSPDDKYVVPEEQDYNMDDI